MGGAANGTQLGLSDICSASNADCTFTINKGMIKSDKNASLAFNAAGGAVDMASIKLSSICTATNPACTWTWSKGQLVSDGSGATPLPINALGGARVGAQLVLNSACNASNPDCVFSIFNESVELDRREQIAMSLSRRSTDSSSSKVRLAYTVRNADAMLETAIVNFDAAQPTNPTSVALLKAAQNSSHSTMFPVFIDPDYIDMPNDERSNTSVLYWEDAPTPTAPDHSFAARYVTIDGDSSISAQSTLSVSNGAARSWNTHAPLGDYVVGGFLWRHKTLNYLAQWVEPGIVKGNVLTVNSTRPGFMVKSDRDLSLAFNAAGGAVNGAPLKLSSICSAGNLSCSWSYRNGMIVSDADPTLALNAAGGAVDGAHIKLSSLCTPSNTSCTWTYRRG